MTENPTGADSSSTIERRVTDIANLGGGIMTEEVGVITGDLTLATELDDGGSATLRVRYKDADEWYAVTGGTCELIDRADLDAVHHLAVGLLNRPDG